MKCINYTNSVNSLNCINCICYVNCINCENCVNCINCINWTWSNIDCECTYPGVLGTCTGAQVHAVHCGNEISMLTLCAEMRSSIKSPSGSVEMFDSPCY